MGSGAVLGGKVIPAPVDVTSWLDGNPKLLSSHVKPRTRPVTQFILHRGVEVDSNDPLRTKGILDGRGLSSLFTLTPDGKLYQHFDPAVSRGAHATHHNVQSDSLDVQGPLSVKKSGSSHDLQRQVVVDHRMAIGRAKDDPAAKAKGQAAQRAAILARPMVRQKQWSLTPPQEATIRVFLPWWCKLRGIPLRACSEFRTFRVGGLGLADPVTDVTGIIAHAQCSGPGERVDGFAELHALKDPTTGITWRDGPEFWA